MKLKTFLLGFWVPILICFIWFIFASPYFIKGRVPFASTYQANSFSPWNAYEKFTGSVKNEAMPDVINQIYPWKHLVIQIWKGGQVPLWNPYSFSGTPLLADYQSAVFAPINILFFIFPFIDGWSLAVLLQPLLAGLFMYLFVRSLKLSKSGSFISSVSFMFCGFITTWMGYATLGYAFLFLPLALFSMEKYYQTEKTGFLFLLSISIPLSLFSGHFQISLYFLISVLAYGIYKLISTKDAEKTFYVALYAIFGLMLSSPQLLPSVEFYLQSFRSTLFQKGEVIPLGYLPALLSPDFFGNPVTRNDWFGHYAEWNGYIGLIPFILAVYGIWGKKSGRAIFFFLLGIIALLFALDTPLLTVLIILRVPVLSTSAASRIISIYAFAFAVLAAFGFDNFMEDFKNKKLGKFVVNLGIFFCLFILMWLIVGLKLFMSLDKIIIARQNLILPSLLFLCFVTAVFIGYKFLKNKQTSVIFVIVVIFILVSFDLLRFADKWQVFDPRDLVYSDTPIASEFSKISGYDRTFGNFGAEVSNYYNLPSVEGYDALYIRNYGELISSLNDGLVKEADRSVVSLPKNGLYTPKAVNLLNIKYIVYRLSDGRQVWAFPFWTYPEGQFKLIYRDGVYEVYENIDSFPHVIFTSNYTVVTNPQEVIDTMFGKNFDLEKQSVLGIKPTFKSSSGVAGKAVIEKYTPDVIDIKVNAGRKGLLLLTDSYYPGWEAKVDGIDTPIYRADYSLRAIEVPKGVHKVEFVYFPLSFRLGIYSAVVGLLAVFGTGLILKKKNGS